MTFRNLFLRFGGMLLVFLWMVVSLEASAMSLDPRLDRLRGERIVDVIFEGDGIPPIAKERALGLRRRPFNPSEVRTLLIWLSENGVDQGVRINLREERSGLVLVISSKERTKIKEILFEGNSAAKEAQLVPRTQLSDGLDFEKESVEEAVRKISLNYSRMG